MATQAPISAGLLEVAIVAPNAASGVEAQRTTDTLPPGSHVSASSAFPRAASFTPMGYCRGGCPISGRCDSRFAAVKEELGRNFAERGEVGVGVCVQLGGRIVVDLVGGWTMRVPGSRGERTRLIDALYASL